MRMIKIIILSICLGFVISPMPCLGEPQVLGLFKNKIVLDIDGKPHVLNVGEEIQGIKLLSANSQECVIALNGKIQTLCIGTQISVNFAPSAAPIVRVMQDAQGLYRYEGKINGHAVNFVIDTGASIVALSSVTAEKIGLNYKNNAPAMVETASGKTKGFQVMLDIVILGGITVYNIPAVVIVGESPRDVLLGEGFLKRVEINNSHHLLELKQKY